MSSTLLRAPLSSGATLTSLLLMTAGALTASPEVARAQPAGDNLTLTPYTLSPSAYSQQVGLAELGSLGDDGAPLNPLTRSELNADTLGCGDVLSVFSVITTPLTLSSAHPLAPLSEGARLTLSYELRVEAPTAGRGAQLEPVRAPALLSTAQPLSSAPPTVRASHQTLGHDLSPTGASLFEAEVSRIGVVLEGLTSGERAVVRHDLALRCEAQRLPRGALRLTLHPVSAALFDERDVLIGAELTGEALTALTQSAQSSSSAHTLLISRLEGLRGARAPLPRLMISLVEPSAPCPSFEEARLSPFELSGPYELSSPTTLKVCYHTANTGGAPLEMSALERIEPSPLDLELPTQLAPNQSLTLEGRLEVNAATWVTASLSGLPPSLNGARLSTHAQQLVRYVTARDADGDGLSDSEELILGTDLFSIDSDDDGLTDDQELALNSDPLDADTDDDGLIDGLEGSLEALHSHDADGDGIYDGTERGVSEPHPDTNTSLGFFRSDLDPDTQSDHLSADTDGGGCSDRDEDPNANGRLDEGEASLTDASDDLDRDGDTLCDVRERTLGTDELDADTDDDGLPDADEPEPTLDVDGDGLTTPLDPDSDGDGLPDGLELGLTEPHADTDLSLGLFTPDADPSTLTDPLKADTDEGGTVDGDEDRDHNGRVDATESDPQRADDDAPDPDGDLIPAQFDLCPAHFDPEQLDLDGDGEGDVCDEDDNGDGVYDGLTSARAQGCDQGSWGAPPSHSPSHSALAFALLLSLLSLLSRASRGLLTRVLMTSLTLVSPSLSAALLTGAELSAMPLSEERSLTLDTLELDPTSSALPGGMASTLPSRPWGLSLSSAWLNRALIVSERGSQGGDESLTELATLLDHRVALTPTLWFKPTPWLLVSASLPFSAYQGRDDLSGALPSPQISAPLSALPPTALGDLQLALRHARALTPRLSLATELSAHLPTATPNAYMGEGEVRPRARLAFGYHRQETRAHLTLSHTLRPLRALLEQDRQDLSSAHLSAEWRARSALWLGLALQAQSDALSRDTLRGGPHHAAHVIAQVAYEGARWGAQLFGARRLYADLTSPDWQAGLKLSVALDTPDWGAIAETLTPRWLKARAERKRAEREAQEAEEKAKARALALKTSPRDPDGDHILSEVDRCPEEAGDLLTEGCPREDMDGDGVLNERDACMWTTGVAANLGCPEGELAIPVELRKPFIFVFSAVELDPSQRAELERLDALASFLKARPSILVHLSGHADYKGDERVNLLVSKQRAQHIQRELITRGVDPARLSLTAFGERAPIVHHSEYEQRIKNRRVTLTFSLSEPTGARP